MDKTTNPNILSARLSECTRLELEQKAAQGMVWIFNVIIPYPLFSKDRAGGRELNSDIARLRGHYGSEKVWLGPWRHSSGLYGEPEYDGDFDVWRGGVYAPADPDASEPIDPTKPIVITH